MNLQAAASSRSHGFRMWVRKRIARRGAFPTLAISTLTLAIACGILANTIADDDFASYADAVWWSLATLTTVGYGDVVPKSTVGRVFGVGIMVLGVTFLSFLTATVTSFFIAADEEEKSADRAARQAEVLAALARVDERLRAIEERLDAGA